MKVPGQLEQCRMQRGKVCVRRTLEAIHCRHALQVTVLQVEMVSYHVNHTAHVKRHQPIERVISAAKTYLPFQQKLMQERMASALQKISEGCHWVACCS